MNDRKFTASLFRLYFCLFCLLLAGLFTGTEACASVFGYTERIISADDGLPATSSLTIGQTTDGMIWIGGYGGLTRYDGREYVICGGSRLSNVTSLLAMEDGTLWIGSRDCGLVRYKENEYYFYQDELLEQVPEEIKCLALAADGTVYFSDSHGVGSVSTDGEISWVREPELSDGNIISIACGSDGEVWCLKKSGEIYSCGDQFRKIEIASEEDTIRSIAYDAFSRQFYLGTETNRVYTCDGLAERSDTFCVEGITSINNFGFPDDGTIFICADDGIAMVENGVPEVLNLAMNNSVEQMIQDMDGNLWFVSSRQGILMMKPGRFQAIEQVADIPDGVVNTIQYEDGRLYVGHDGGFYILDEKTYETIEDEIYQFLDGKRIRHIFLDSREQMWICTTGDGLYMRSSDGKEWTHYTSDTDPVIGSNKFRCVIETEGGVIAGADDGAYVIRDGEVTRLNESLDRRVLCLLEKDGVVYVGTEGGGVIILKDGKIINRLTLEDGLTSMYVLKIVESTDKSGIWLATGNNLEYYNPKIGEMLHADNFPYSNVLDCLMTDNGTLWVLTGNGIYTISEFLLQRGGEVFSYRYYNKKNGIPYDTTANSFPAIVGDHAYLCGADGVTWADLSPENNKKVNYRLLIDEVRMDDEMLYVQGQEQIPVNSNVRRLEIKTHMTNYTQEDPMMFYYLEGFEEERHYVSYQKMSSIVYTNIPGGDYVFHFGVFDPETSTETQEVQLGLNVDYIWYERPGILPVLFLIVIALIGLLIWGWFRAREQRTKRDMQKTYYENEQVILEKMAYTDYLTGLYNRNYLGLWSKEFSGTCSFPVSVVGIDCNNLKLINDRFGHAMGDVLLKTLAELMNSCFSEETSRILRIGGDEFLIIAEGMDELEAEKRMQDIMQEAVARKVCEIPLSFCYGVAMGTDQASFDIELMIRKADERMIRSKQIFHSQAYLGEKDTQTPYDVYVYGSGVERHTKNDILSNVLYEAFAESTEYVYIYVLDMSTGISRWSKHCVEYFGLPSEYMVGAENIWMEHVHPDDREAYYQDLMAVFEGIQDRHDCQYRALNRYGEYVWVECKGFVVRGSNGKNVFAGMMTRLDNQSIYDPLTGLKTKNQFYDTVFDSDKGIAVLIDIDRFKDVIGVYGYESGDRVLISLGKTLMRLSSENRKVYRFNGDEFIFVLPDGSEQDLQELFCGVIDSMSTVILDKGIRLDLSFTGGATRFSRADDTVDTIVNRMEITLDYAKSNRRGTCVFYSEEILEREKRRRKIKKELKGSINADFEGFELFFQPIMNVDGKRIAGCEALLRWTGSDILDSDPSEFIGILEETNSIVEVGRFVMKEAMKEQKRLSDKYKDFFVSFNVSYHQFLVDGYVDELVETARQLGVNPSGMIIELTESCSVQSPKALAEIFAALRSHGFRIALDDFGTGYASLELLKKLPCDGIKIEHGFVRELQKEGHEIDHAIIRSLLLLCNELEHKVILEGVENEEVAEIVSNMKAGYLQGFYYSHPVCRSEFEKLVDRNRKDTAVSDTED